MNKESLLKTKRIINEALVNEKCDDDILEIVINLNHFLNPKNYDDNIKTLRKRESEQHIVPFEYLEKIKDK